MPRAIRILIVDDNAAVGESVGRLLRRRGDTVRIAPSIDAAWTLLNQHTFDKALIDLTLPDGDGLTLAIEIHREYPTIGIVLMTGGNMPVTAEFGMIQKPFNLEQLWAAMA